MISNCHSINKNANINNRFPSSQDCNTRTGNLNSQNNQLTKIAGILMPILSQLLGSLHAGDAHAASNSPNQFQQQAHNYSTNGPAGLERWASKSVDPGFQLTPEELQQIEQTRTNDPTGGAAGVQGGTSGSLGVTGWPSGSIDPGFQLTPEELQQIEQTRTDNP